MPQINTTILTLCTVSLIAMLPVRAAPSGDGHPVNASAFVPLPVVSYHTVKEQGLDIFYREAGPSDGP